VPKIPQFVAGPASSGRRATALDFGGDQGLSATAGAFDEAAEAGARIDAAYRGALRSRVAMEASAEIDALATDLEGSPDWPRAEKRFEEERAKIVERHSKGLQFPADREAFEQEIFPGVERTRLGVRRFVRERQIDESLAALEGTLQKGADLTIRARTPESREATRSLVGRAIGRAQAGGVLTAEQAGEMADRFDAEVAEGSLREALRVDPAGTYRRLSDPNDELARTLPEVKRQAWLGHALEAVESDLRQRRSDEAAERAAAERFEQNQRESALEKGDEVLAQRDPLALQAFLRENWSVLSHEDRKFYQGRLEQGGGFTDKESDRGAYVDLFERASKGEVGPTEIDTAFRLEQINKSDRDSLIRLQSEARFKDAARFLSDALIIVEKDDPAARRLSAEAEESFASWALSNPEATREDAMSKAREIAVRSARFEHANKTSSMLLPKFVTDRQILKAGADWGHTLKESDRQTTAHYLARHGFTDLAEPGAEAALAADDEYQRELALSEDWFDELTRADERLRHTEETQSAGR
jgi:hypothetical protein